MNSVPCSVDCFQTMNRMVCCGHDPKMGPGVQGDKDLFAADRTIEKGPRGGYSVWERVVKPISHKRF